METNKFLIKLDDPILLFRCSLFFNGLLLVPRPKDYISQLPDDLFKLLLPFLSRSDWLNLYHCSSVIKHFFLRSCNLSVFKLSKEASYDFYINKNEMQSKLPPKLCWITLDQKIDYKVDNVKVIISDLSSLHGCRVVDLRNCKDDINLDPLREAVGVCLQGLNGMVDIACMKKLKVLDIISCPGIYEHQFSELNNLRKLTVFGVKISSLKYFHNKDCEYFLDYCINPILLNLVKERSNVTFGLRGKQALDFYLDPNSSLIKKKIYFIWLGIGLDEDTTLDMIHEFASTVENLEVLRGIESVFITACLKVKSIEPLRLSRNVAIFHLPLVHDFSPLSNLYSVSILDCQGLTDVRVFKHVRQLYLHRCHNLRNLSSLITVEQFEIKKCFIKQWGLLRPLRSMAFSYFMLPDFSLTYKYGILQGIDKFRSSDDYDFRFDFDEKF